MKSIVPIEPPPQGIFYYRVQDTRDPFFRPSLDLLKRTFPPSERPTMVTFRAAIVYSRVEPWSYYLIAAVKGRKVVGVVTGHYWPDHNLGMIGLLAVHPSFKGIRMGTGLRRRLILWMDQDAREAGRTSLATLVGEVEENNPWLKILIERRNVLALDFEYYQPAVRKKGKAVPLVLYVYSFRSPRRYVKRTELIHLLKTIYTYAYHIPFPERHPQFKKMIRSIGGRVRIGKLQATARSGKRALELERSGFEGNDRTKACGV